MESIWHLVPSIRAAMPFQLALNELLFRDREESYCRAENKDNALRDFPPILRFYYASEAVQSIGYLQRQGFNEPMIRRLTGGGIVRHGGDFLFTLVAHKGHDESFQSVRISYLKIHEAVKRALEKRGDQPRFYRCDEDLPPGEHCFASPIATDLALDGRKVAGGAQKRSSRMMLHEESLQLRGGVRSREFEIYLTQAFSEIFKVRVIPVQLPPEILRRAESLAREKYQPLNRSQASLPAEGVCA